MLGYLLNVEQASLQILHALSLLEEVRHAHLFLRHLDDLFEVALADGSQFLLVLAHDAAQGFHGAQGGEDLIESAGYLVEEANLDFVQLFLQPQLPLDIHALLAVKRQNFNLELHLEVLGFHVFIALLH